MSEGLFGFLVVLFVILFLWFWIRLAILRFRMQMMQETFSMLGGMFRESEVEAERRDGCLLPLFLTLSLLSVGFVILAAVANLLS